MTAIKSVNPATGRLIREYTPMGPTEVSDVISLVADSQLRWRLTSVSERAEALTRVASLLRSKATEFAGLMAREMGKPVKQGIAEVEKSACGCDYYAENGAEFLGRDSVQTQAQQSFVSYQPLGVVLAIMPWNFPFWQFFRFAAPTLMAGNCVVLKHASNVTGCALAIEQVMREAGFPCTVCRTLVIGSGAVEEVIAHPQIAAVTLTGSTAAGRAVAAAAGRVLKKCVLELGGSDPYVVLKDADLDLAAKAAVDARLGNSGQSCIAAKRLIAVEPVFDEFARRVVEMMSARTMGDPMNESTQIGPLARVDLRDELHAQVVESVRQGASCALGGEIPQRPGAYYPATVLMAVKPGMPAYDQELFGPVAALIRVSDEAQAIRVANDTEYGLGAAVFTGDVERGVEIAECEMHAGCVFVNDFVRSDPRLPFGGIKNSGFGRELSWYGLREFVNAKTIWVK